MSGVFRLNVGQQPPSDKYALIGLPGNPFVPQDTDGGIGPFYAGHLGNEISQMNQWLEDALSGYVSPLSIKGSIGVGKTRILQQVQVQINELSAERRVFAGYARIDKTGYSRPSLGQMLLETLEEANLTAEMSSAPEGVVSILWAAVLAPRMDLGNSRMGRVISKLQSAEDAEKPERARLVSRWLHRETLTASQGEKVGLSGRVDYEGQLPEVLADLIRCLKRLGVLDQLFFMIDQLEDVFRTSYSDLRRSRILTDLRSLIDEIDNDCPIALILAWSPEVDEPRAFSTSRTDLQLNREYPALYSRLIRHMIELNKLDQFQAAGFAETYLSSVSLRPGFDVAKAPKALELASEAWKKLDEGKKAVDNRASARDLLAALRSVVEERANSAKAAIG